AAVDQRNALRRAHDRALDVRGRVVVDPIVEPPVVVGDGLAQRRDEIDADVRVVVLVDGDGGRRVRREHAHDAVARARLGDDALDLGRDVDDLIVGARGEVERWGEDGHGWSVEATSIATAASRARGWRTRRR